MTDVGQHQDSGVPFSCCIVVPVYDHEHAVGSVVDRLLHHGVTTVLVDDGSSAPCAAELDRLAARSPQQVKLLRLPTNQGKGAAVMAGCRHAAQLGFSHALQVDADGQHCIDDVPRFIAAARAQPATIIAGCPVFDDSVPKGRLIARYLTHVFVWINTLSFAIRDSMCGFRVYPLVPLLALADRQPIGRRMNFDTDVIVRMVWAGSPVRNLPTAVTYPADGVSHFRMWRDNVLITRMHTVLFFGMLGRLPLLLARKVKKS